MIFRDNIYGSISDKGKRRVWPNTILMSLVICIFLSIVTLSLVPPVSKDALVHHLAVPKLYIQHGGMYEIPFMDFSYYPMNLQLLYMIPLYLGSDIAPKFIHFFFALLTAWLIFHYLKQRINSTYGILGVLLFLSIPIIVKLSITVYIDLGEIFFSFAALLLMMEWLRNDFKIKYIIYSGLLCGLALGTKYNGLVILALMALFIPFTSSRYYQGKKLGFLKSVTAGIVFSMVALLLFSPWMIRNYHWKKNPIYPLYNHYFNPPSPVTISSIDEEDKDKAVKMNKGFFTYRSIVYKESGWQIALLPLRIFFQGRDGDPQYFDGKLNPFLFFLPFFAFFRLREDPEYILREKKIFLAFSLLFFFIAFFTSVLRIRYIAPIIPPLTVLAIFGIKNLFNIVRNFKNGGVKKTGALFIIFIMIFFFSFNIHYIIDLFKIVDPFPFIRGKINRDEYIARYIPEYSALKYINGNLDSHAKLLFVFLGRRGYYCDREYIFDNSILQNSIKNAEIPEDILKGIREKGITHMLINYRLFERWMEDNFSTEKQELTKKFFQNNADLLFYEQGFGVNLLGKMKNRIEHEISQTAKIMCLLQVLFFYEYE